MAGENKNKIFLKIIDALQKQLQDSQTQISTLTKEIVKISDQLDKLKQND
mgnify:CR=1 FL=1